MTILFNIEDDRAYWASKPMSLIGRLIGDEGKGSLLSYLKEKGWVLGLGAGNIWRTFSINIELTKQGRKEYQEVLKAVFTYLQFVQEKGYPEYLFTDEKNIRKIDLDNLEPSSSGGRAAWFASAMTEYPVDEFLERNFLLSKYSVEDFKKFLAYLKPESAHVLVSSQKEKTNEKEDIFGIEYSSEVIPAPVLSAKIDTTIFNYPEQNKYIPNDFSLVKSDKKIFSPEVSVLSGGNGTIASQTDTELGIAKSTMRLHVISEVEHNVRNKVMMDLFVQAKREEQREWAYPISEARADLGISSVKGDEMEIDISGYTQRLMTIFGDGIKNPQTGHTINSLNVSESIFNDIKDRYKRDLLNIEELVAYSRLSLEAGSVADSKGMNWHEYAKAVDGIKLTDVQKYIVDFFSTIHVKGYAYGNIEKASLEKSIQQLFEVTKAKTLTADKVVLKEAKFRVVPIGKNYSVVISGRNNNHAHFAFYRLSDWTVENHARGLLLDQMLSQPYFSELRTKQQLGYVARSGVATHSGYVALTAMIQSSQTGSKELQEKSDVFLSTFLKEKAEKLTDEEIKPFKESIVNELLMVPNTLGERAGQFFTAADKYDGRFTIRKDIADAITKITAEDLKKFIKATFFSDKKGQIVYYYSGKGSKVKSQKLPGETFDDAHRIKNWDTVNPYIKK
ncbi:MAG: insulinase family protein [Bdellovibrionaceae bacterium]|nr:insulinase family protein [Pseudobdellovibrionaceae bacterium]